MVQMHVRWAGTIALTIGGLAMARPQRAASAADPGEQIARAAGDQTRR